MSLQMRSKDGSDKRWFDPERDFVYAFPRLIKTALKTFDTFEGVPGCTREQLCDACAKLGALVCSAAKGPVKPAEYEAALEEIRKTSPEGYTLISGVVFYILMGMYPRWCADVRPRTPEDAEIQVQDLESVLSGLARTANPAGKSGDAVDA